MTSETVKGWHRVSLDEVAESKTYGFTASATSDIGGPKFLRITDIVNGRSWDQVPYSDARPADAEKYRLQDGDVVICRTGANVGEAAELRNPPEAIFASYLVRFRFDRSRVAKRFIGCLLSSPGWRNHVQAQKSGSGQPQFNASRMGEFHFDLPPLDEQYRIAGVLGVLEDKIQLNRELADKLDNAARLVFRSHFMDLGDQFDLVGSEIGEIPKGWKVARVKEVSRCVLGGTPARSNKSYWTNGTVGWINSGKVNEFRIIEPTDLITQEALKKSAAKKLPMGATVLAITGATLGQISRLEIETSANQSVVGVIGTDLPDEYLLYALEDAMGRLTATATGGAQQHINKGNVEDLALLKPPEDQVAGYMETVRPIFASIRQLLMEAKTLTNIREELLPRLISGRVRVPASYEPSGFVQESLSNSRSSMPEIRSEAKEEV